MNNRIAQEVQKFLKIHYEKGRALLLGFSGGPDSLALLHLLLDLKNSYAIDLHLAHVDHGWRKESSREAKLLQDMAENLGLPFHLEVLKGEVFGNLELYAREKRLAFFSKIYKQIDAQALLLAHHADDQAETILKRLFEGSSIFSLGGVKKITYYQDIVIWRPLHGIVKKDILRWLEKKNLKGLKDSTNENPKYLRARMRSRILPELSTLFGKEVSYNLYSLGQSAQKLKCYFERKTNVYIQALQHDFQRRLIDLNPFFPIEELELEALIKEIFHIEGFVLSRETVFLIQNLIQKNESNKRIVFKKNIFVIDKRRIFLKTEVVETKLVDD